MTPAELATEIYNSITAVQQRILVQGAEQYQNPDGSQQFETMPLSDLITYAREEIQDQADGPPA